MEQAAGATLGIAIALLIWIVVGGLAGWLAGLVVKGGGFGFWGDVLLGVVGAVVAGWLFPTLGLRLGGGVLGAILAAAVGAIIVLLVVRLVRRENTSR